MKQYKDASNLNLSYKDYSNSSMSMGIVSSTNKEDSFISLIKHSTMVYSPDHSALKDKIISIKYEKADLITNK